MIVLSLFDGEYEVTSRGLVFSNKRKSKVRLIGKVGREGYNTIMFTVNGKRIYKNAHRIVAESFIPNPNNYPQVNHKDGNKLNNSVENLEWVSPSENLLHARNLGLLNTCKITNEIAELIRNEKGTHREIASIYGISKTQVGLIKQNKRWKIE